METESQIAQLFIDARSSQEYRDYLRAFAQKAVNIAQILTYINNCGGDAHPNKIAEDLSISSAQMAVLLNHMEDAGYIERIPDEQDHRKIIVRLTESGINYRKELAAKYHSYIDEIFKRMGEEKSKLFVELFSEFIKTGAQIRVEKTIRGIK